MRFCILLLFASIFLTSWLSTAKGEVEVKCLAPHIPNGNYTPHRINYTAEDEIQYECTDGFYPTTQGTVAKCTSTGWIPAPRCSLEPCDFPQFKNGYLYHENIRRSYFPVPIGKEFSYYCDNGFLTPSGSYWDYLRCTRQGWEPEVPCLKTCLKSDIEIENGFLSQSDSKYLQNKKAQYMCKQGYVTADGETSGSITCLENGWSAQPSCLKSCDVPVFENSVTKNNSTWFKLNDKLDYECHIGYKNKYKHTKSSITCTYEGWSDEPTCYDSTKICGPPPPIENGDITSFPLPVYIPPSSVDYQCQYLYQMQGNKTIICINGDWSEPPKCLRMACKPPDIPNGIYSPQRVTYTAQDEIKFECKDGFYSATQETVAKCTSTGWIPAPKCMKPCEFPQIKNGGLYHERRRRPYFPVPIGNEYSYYCDNGFLTPSLSYWDYLRCTEKGWEPEVPCLKSCDVPIFENAGTNNDSTWFKLNDKINYECHVGYVNKHKHTKGSITCHHDGWSDIPSCYDSTKICGPPPPIANGDTTSFPLPVYIPPSSVEYQCQSLYQLQGNKTIICINGEWSDPPKCLHPCIISIEIMRKHNITFRTEENQRLYYQSGEMQEFKCKNGHHLATTQPLITICINGHLNYPVCTK
ncbi:complement factor H-related 2 isoform X3 [Rattus norvegicus]|uniref:Complement factor H-related 2 n=1 Tax=Rattus norvegicus TaxID=10116 RepID=A0A8I6AN28_RAT|nr:complement factor H-related 2 isoform X3 [Rattus norvegicus]|eukprot:XP_006250010.1 PREDICTED: complement factor H-related protein 4 isoform X3 [Rattus norvegicus]